MNTLSSLSPPAFGTAAAAASARDVSARSPGTTWPDAALDGGAGVLHVGPSPAGSTTIDDIERSFLLALCDQDPR